MIFPIALSLLYCQYAVYSPVMLSSSVIQVLSLVFYRMVEDTNLRRALNASAAEAARFS